MFFLCIFQAGHFRYYLLNPVFFGVREETSGRMTDDFISKLIFLFPLLYLCRIDIILLLFFERTADNDSGRFIQSEEERR